MTSCQEKYVIRLVNTADSFRCPPEVDVLRGMEQLGFKGIPVGCRGGGCGVCKVRVLRGDYRVRKMSRACVSAEEEAAGIVLACKLFPRDDLEVEVLGCMVKGLTAKRPKCDPCASTAETDASPTGSNSALD
jgi:ferredoxin